MTVINLLPGEELHKETLSKDTLGVRNVQLFT